MANNNDFLTNTFGVVVCGGKSSRMGRDKSLLQYYEKPQRYHVYDMLLPFCEKVFISCNTEQADTIEEGYKCIEDSQPYNNIGPMAALLSAFSKFPEKNILLIGCDYPFLMAAELEQFAKYCKTLPAGFYNEAVNKYEPLLAWYPTSSLKKLNDNFKSDQFSLQSYLKDVIAVKYYPANKKSLISIDTQEDFDKALAMLNQ